VFGLPFDLLKQIIHIARLNRLHFSNLLFEETTAALQGQSSQSPQTAIYALHSVEIAASLAGFIGAMRSVPSVFGNLFPASLPSLPTFLQGSILGYQAALWTMEILLDQDRLLVPRRQGARVMKRFFYSLNDLVENSLKRPHPSISFPLAFLGFLLEICQPQTTQIDWINLHQIYQKRNPIKDSNQNTNEQNHNKNNTNSEKTPIGENLENNENSTKKNEKK